MKINASLWPTSFLITVILSTFLGLAYSAQDYNQDEQINPPFPEQNHTEYNPDLESDYSSVKSIDNNTEPASNLVILPDPAGAAQYEANVYNQTETDLSPQNASPAFKSDDQDDQTSRPTESENKKTF